MEQLVKRPHNRKPLYFVISFLTVFSVFVYAIIQPSERDKALKELATCNSIEYVKASWDKYKTDLYEDKEYVRSVRTKLASFNLADSEIIQCRKWLPVPEQYLNIIVVPDLSKRIADNINNPNQVFNDTVILRAIWSEFKSALLTKSNSKDRLIIDVTDDEQAGGNFRNLADSLIYDLSGHNKFQSNRFFFEKIGNRFQSNIRSLYTLALQKPIGADYWYYFNRNLPKKIKQSTLFEDYRNVVILLTDGYLEAQDNQRTGILLYTGSHALRETACTKIKQGKPIRSAINEMIPAIRDCSTHFPEVEVLIVEVNERRKKSRQEPFDDGTSCDFEILKTLWTQWFRTLEIKNANDNFFIQRNDATQLTIDEVIRFLKTGEPNS